MMLHFDIDWRCSFTSRCEKQAPPPTWVVSDVYHLHRYAYVRYSTSSLFSVRCSLREPNRQSILDIHHCRCSP